VRRAEIAIRKFRTETPPAGPKTEVAGTTREVCCPRHARRSAAGCRLLLTPAGLSVLLLMQ
jgi:hypothetical protein